MLVGIPIGLVYTAFGLARRVALVEARWLPCRGVLYPHPAYTRTSQRASADLQRVHWRYLARTCPL